MSAATTLGYAPLVPVWDDDDLDVPVRPLARSLATHCTTNNTGRFLLVRGEWCFGQSSPDRGHQVSAPQEGQAAVVAAPSHDGGGEERPVRAFRCYRGQDVPKFVNDAERECAEVLDYYGVPWEYEPVTFVLETDDDGRVLEAFCPDFYLPEQNLFLEITTMRQELVTRKNRKLRKLRQRYPDVNVKLFYRRDIEALGQKLRSRGGFEHECEPMHAPSHDEVVADEVVSLVPRTRQAAVGRVPALAAKA